MDEKITRVKNLYNNKVGVISSLLSSQFTVLYDDDSMEFFFYTDRNDTWEVVNESNY